MNPGTIQDFNICIRITKSSSVYANKTSTVDVNVWPHVTLKDKLVSVFKSLAGFHLPQSFEQGLACKKNKINFNYLIQILQETRSRTVTLKSNNSIGWQVSSN